MFVVATVVAGIVRPGYGQATHFLSELGEHGASTALGINLALALVGACLVVFSLAIRGRAGWLLAAAGAGFVVMAASPCSQGCPIAIVNAKATASDAIHNAAAIVAIAGIGFAALDLALAPGATARYRRFSTASGVGIAITSMLFLLAVVVASPLAIGVSERVMVAIGLVWLEATAIKVRMTTSSSSRRSRGPTSGRAGRR